MKAKANPGKLDRTIKDYLVIYGSGVEGVEHLRLVGRDGVAEDPYYLIVRVFVERGVLGSHERAMAMACVKQKDIAAEWGKLDSELEEVLRGWWRHRRLLAKHIPSSHLPVREGCAHWFNARLSFAQIGALSLESWVQEIRTVAIPSKLIEGNIPMLTKNAIAKALRSHR